MLNADVLTFKEFMMHEPLLLSTLHRAVLDFLRGRSDAVLFGTQAVNAYVSEPRMTQDVDLMSNRAKALAEELKQHLHGTFQIAVRVREIGEGKGYRLYQVQSSGNRHLVDLRPVESLPLARRIEQVWVMAPAELIASKVISYHQRRGQTQVRHGLAGSGPAVAVFSRLEAGHRPRRHQPECCRCGRVRFLASGTRWCGWRSRRKTRMMNFRVGQHQRTLNRTLITESKIRSSLAISSDQLEEPIWSTLSLVSLNPADLLHRAAYGQTHLGGSMYGMPTSFKN